MESKLRQLPSVDRLMGEKKIQNLVASTGFPHSIIVGLIRENLDCYRAEILRGRMPPTIDEIINNIVNQAEVLYRPSLRPLINATGVVLHTNLGRAPLSEEAIAAMENICRRYNNLEFDLESGERGSRHSHIESLLCRLTGAEAGLVINNNASAVMVGLSAMARGKEVIISRGQAVEIGGGFRIPEVMRQSGARLIEVGTTNCTYIRDYEQAITPRTAALLRVHSSNFKVVGFTHTVELEEMTALGQQYNLPILDDLGSGCLLDTTRFGLNPEPLVQNSISKGAGLVFFSGDKLLGGPQAGIIVGKKIYIDILKKHPLIRAMRVDKMRLSALAVTLMHYLKEEATQKIPIWRMISMPLSEIECRARLWAGHLEGKAKVIDGESVIGGGSLPGAALPTRVVAIGDDKNPGLAQKLAQKLRRQDTPVIGRVSDNILLLDPRTVLLAEDAAVEEALKQAMQDINQSS